MANKPKANKYVGAEVEKILSASGQLDPDIFEKQPLRLLQISSPKIQVSCFPLSWPSLVASLEELDLSGCALTTCPTGIFTCTQLRALILRDNSLTSLPDVIGQLNLLISLSVDGNKLSDLPQGLVGCTKLATMHCARNEFVQFPAVLAGLPSLRELGISHNRIEEVNPDLCPGLNKLFVLDMSSNQVTFLPSEMADAKFKTLRIAGNPFEDKQLKKLADGDGPVKSILTKARGGKSKRVNKDEIRVEEAATKSATESKQQAREEKLSLSRLGEFVTLLPPSSSVTVQGDEVVAQLRPFLTCVIVRRIRFPNLKFVLDLQNKLHKEVGGTRAVAAIGVHDLARMAPGPLSYDGLDSAACRLRPLRQDKELSAVEVVEAFRGDPLYAAFAAMLCRPDGAVAGQVCVLRDSSGQVLSLPPLINGAATAISADTTDIFVEVSSTSSLEACKRMAGLFLGRLAAHLQAEQVLKTMTVEPVCVRTAGVSPARRKGAAKAAWQVCVFPSCMDDYDCIQEAADCSD